ncbi:MAG: hypothetical protein KF774_09270 [Planctomyces sp.]|nr:hypothetical protein [Planctomyces sp.]
MAFKTPPRSETPDVPRKPIPPVPPSKPAIPPLPHVTTQPPAPVRLVSLDAFRGLIMTLLAAHGFGLYALSQSPEDSPVWNILNRDSLQRIAFHFEHPPQWRSNFPFGASTDPTAGNPLIRGAVSMWDLIQPSFMFMVGVAIPFSTLRRKVLGETLVRRWTHAAVRALILVLMGVFLYSLDNTRTDWIFPNVLAQIGLGYLFAYSVVGLRWHWQALAAAAVLILTWLAFFVYQAPQDYDFAEVNASADRGEVLDPPFRQWSKNGNVAHAFDEKFLNAFPRPPEENPWRFNGGGYQTLNFVPSIATMILGVLCGQLLLASALTPWRKVGWLLLAAIICYGLGLAAGAWACPIVKRIWTPSWALFSAGYVIGILALMYVLFDIFPFRKLAFPLVVVGTNSLLMYLLGETMTGWTRRHVVHTHFQPLLERISGWIASIAGWEAALASEGRSLGASAYAAFQPVIDFTAVFAVFWLIAFLLYRKKILFRV